MFELFHNIKAVAGRTGDTQGAAVSATVTGAIIDCAGYHTLTFLVIAGDNDGNAFDGTNKLTFTVQEDDDSAMGAAAEIAAADYIGAKDSTGATWDRILDEAAGDNMVYQIGVRTNTHRYMRVLGTMAGTVSSFPLAIVAVLGSPRHAPV